MEEAQWYFVHTYSGYENKVAQNLMTLVVKNGAKKTVQKKLFPGYVFVKMCMTDETWYIVRNTRGVTGFVGPSSKPVPLSQAEVDKLGVESRELVVDYTVGANVEIIDGPMTGFIGMVDSIDAENRKVKVTVSMFGRDTLAELDLTQVKPV